MSFITAAGIASDRITPTIELTRGYAQFVRLTDAADVCAARAVKSAATQPRPPSPIKPTPAAAANASSAATGLSRRSRATS